jgi:murein DD-endopeptidase MepM/ murein hydrolase activator NlpD
MMKNALVVLIVISFLLTSCAGNSGLWGSLPTPTPEGGLIIASDTPTVTPTRITYPLVPSRTPTATNTPLAVLPPAGSSTPGVELKVTPTLAPINTSDKPYILYYAQSGDTIQLVAERFNVTPPEILSDVVLPAITAMLAPGTLLLIPDVPLEGLSPGVPLIPDSEVVYSPSAIDFKIEEYVNNAGGLLATYREYLMSNAWTTGAQSVELIAQDNSINPRILLGIIEYESKWVRGTPTNFAENDYPLGYADYHYRGLFRQLMWAVQELQIGYYGWRDGSLNQITFEDGETLRLNPKLNAGTAAIYYFFAQTRTRLEWEQAIDPAVGFPATYNQMFGDPWQRAKTVEPLLPLNLTQPELILPFEPGKTWAFTGGPHSAWEKQGALAAVDFAPGSDEQGCIKSDLWVLAPAPGKVVRVSEGVVILDLDGDGHEQTGWAMLFLHIATEGKVKLGAELKTGDKIGHPSCEGGVSTGTHVHIARKYNGEWVLAGGNIPFNLGGWIAANGEAPYKGTLTKGDKIVIACTCGSFETRIVREKE